MTIFARVPRKPSLQERMLVCYRLDEALPDEGYDAVVEIVADIFWRYDRKFRSDVIAALRQIGG